MRLEGAAAVPCGERPAGEEDLACLLGPLLRGAPRPPELVVDGRAPGAASGSTAAYRLLAALDLRRASPVATWVAAPGDALAVLERLSSLLEGDALGLLVACGRVRDGGWWAGGCLFAPGPAAGRSGLGELPEGDGLLSLTSAWAARPAGAR